jgi:hypothetical protein
MNEILTRAIRQSARARILTMEQMQAEREAQSAAERIAKIAFHKTVGKFAVKALGRSIGGERVIGAGCEQLVFISKDQQQVTKLLVNTLGSSKSQAKNTASYQQELFDTAAYYLGDFLQETSYRTVALPRSLGKYAVVSTQPAVTPIKSFSYNLKEIWDYDEGSEYQAHHLALGYGINDLYKGTGMFPDLFGNGNVVILEDGYGNSTLRILDTIVETPDSLSRIMFDGTAQTREERYNELLDQWLVGKSSIAPTESQQAAAHQI